MPKVGSKEFKYTKEGMRAAKEYANKTGKSMEMPQHKSGKKGKK